MKMMAIALSALLCGCGLGPNKIDPAFQPLYDEFIKDSGIYGKQLDVNQGLTIQFYKLEQKTPMGEVIGECSNVDHGGGVVSVDPDYWSFANDDLKLLLIFHELGHCVLALYHTDDPESIMNPVINNPFYYEVDLNVMLSKLFR